MQTELIVKAWRVEERDVGNATITGTYAVCLNGKEIATQEFNSCFGGVEVKFPQEIRAQVNAICVSIKKEIQKSFTN